MTLKSINPTIPNIIAMPLVAAKALSGYAILLAVCALPIAWLLSAHTGRVFALLCGAVAVNVLATMLLYLAASAVQLWDNLSGNRRKRWEDI